MQATRLAGEFNCIIASMPLSKPHDCVSLGRWFGSKEIKITVKEGLRTPLLRVESAAASSFLSKDATPSPAAALDAEIKEAVPVRSTSFTVGDSYRLQVTAGVIYSRLRDEDFIVTERVSAVDSSVARQVLRTRNRDYHLLPSIELLFFPFSRQEYLPWRVEFSRARPGFLRRTVNGLAILGGFSIADPSQDFFLGGALMHPVGLGIKAGWHFGFEDRAPVLMEGETTLIEEDLDHAGFVGIAISGEVFKSLLAPILKP
jgi:hypothetical protein